MELKLVKYTDNYGATVPRVEQATLPPPILLLHPMNSIFSSDWQRMSARTLCCAFLLLAVGLPLQSPLWSQDTIARQPMPLEANQHVVFLLWRDNPDVQRCGVCHYSPGNEFAKRDTDFCRLTELKQWLEHDKHAIARQRVEPIDPEHSESAVQRLKSILQRAGGGAAVELPTGWVGPSNFLSYAICQQMGYDTATEAGYAKFRENCMTCHGGYQTMEASRGFSHDNSNSPGISCNYCHQIHGDSRWIDQHSSLQAKSTWRVLTPEAKAAYGMRDLASVAAQAKLCYSCHIGDLQQNMFVSHQMYAAGHPPLPSVELATLQESMPRHWRTPVELFASLADYPQRSEYFLNTFPDLRHMLEKSTAGSAKPARESTVDLGQLAWQTDAMVGGALAAQQQWLGLLERAAEPDESRRDVIWGDYAFYDCAACHHELRIPSNRQRVRSAGAPGRPRLHEWPRALVRAMGVTSPMHETLFTLEQQLSRAVAERPFGNRESVRQSAAALSAAIEQLRPQLAARSWTREFSLELLKALVHTPDEMLLDYHTARQLTWALRGLDAEMVRLGHAAPQDVRDHIAKLGNDPALKLTVSTDLPSGLGQAIFPEFVRQELQHQADYDGRVFSGQLKALSDVINSSLP